jgi:microcystin-dependent protein
VPIEPFLAEIMIFAGNFAPRGWAFCDGQVLSIAQNTALFALLGTTYGGNGITTFALPDLRGRAPVHVGQGPGLSAYALGQTFGAQQVALTDAHAASHTHQAHALHGPTSGTSADPSGARWAYSDELPYAPSANGVMAADAAGQTGDGAPHDNMAPYLVLNYVIALEGIFPSRS